MITQKRFSGSIVLFSLFIIINLSLSACCPPNCPPAPPNLTPNNWDPWLEEGSYDQIMQETSQVILEGESAQYYAEARLYRGMAILRSNGNIEEAKADLDIAESRIDELNTVDGIKEQVLLFRGQMIINVKFGNFEAADSYRDRAIEMAPELEDVILQEYEEAKQY